MSRYDDVIRLLERRLIAAEEHVSKCHEELETAQFQIVGKRDNFQLARDKVPQWQAALAVLREHADDPVPSQGEDND